MGDPGGVHLGIVPAECDQLVVRTDLQQPTIAHDDDAIGAHTVQTVWYALRPWLDANKDAARRFAAAIYAAGYAGAPAFAATMGAPAAAHVPTGSPLLAALREAGGFSLAPKQAWTNVADFAASLSPLGAATSFVQTRAGDRGGMRYRDFSIRTATRSLTLSTFTTPDGKLAQYLIHPAAGSN